MRAGWPHPPLGKDRGCFYILAVMSRLHGIHNVFGLLLSARVYSLMKPSQCCLEARTLTAPFCRQGN